MQRDERIKKYSTIIAAMKHGRYDELAPLQEDILQNTDEFANLGKELVALSKYLQHKSQEIDVLSEVSQGINAGYMLNDIIDHVFDHCDAIIPYDRIGVALLSDDRRLVRAQYARSRSHDIYIRPGYLGQLAGSSLEHILSSGTPRVINDLAEYFSRHPESDSTKQILKEKVLSSFTCPLVANGRRVGFIFFSSFEKNTYKDLHAELFLKLANNLSLAVERAISYQHMFELNQQKNKLLGMVAHDLRNPLSNIISYVELLSDGQMGELPSEAAPVFEVIKNNSEQMLLMIEDLLDMTVVESGHVDLNYSEVSVSSYLTKVIESHRLLASKKHIHLTLDCDSNLHTLSFDKARIDQVFTNLITNAIKFSMPNKQVTIGATQLANQDITQFFVKDEGQGIPKNEIEKLFQPFAKLSVHPTGGERSTGLGLSIVHKMITLHQGHIWAESQSGVGTTFFFILPKNKAKPQKLSA